jgi:hypothetical protein
VISHRRLTHALASLLMLTICSRRDRRARMTDARQEGIKRRRLIAVAVTVVSLIALIVLLQDFGSPSRGGYCR